MPPARLGPTDAAVPRQGKGRNGMRGQRLLPGLQAAAAGGSVWGGVELWGEVKQRERTGGRAGGARGGRAGGLRSWHGRREPPPPSPPVSAAAARSAGCSAAPAEPPPPTAARCRLSPPARRSPGTRPPRRSDPTSPPRTPHVNESCYPRSLSAFPSSDEVRSFNSTARPALFPLSLPPFFFSLSPCL